MDRKEFLTTCSYACLGITGASLLMESCTPPKLIQATAVNNVITLSKNEFLDVRNEKNKVRRHIVVKIQDLDFPIVVYRFSDADFSALVLRCSHQGSQLDVNGDMLTCPAHGSEFSNRGEVIQGPADAVLTSCQVTSDLNSIYIRVI